MPGVRLMASSFLLRLGIRYLLRNPEKNLPSLVSWAKRTTLLSRHKKLLHELDTAISDPSNHWLRLYQRACRQLHPNVREKAFYNFFLNAGLVGMPRIDETRRKTGINIPWAILMDPTSACNLNCIGCWAADYEKGAHLTKETLDRIITEGKTLGIYMYLYSGGEPLLRFNDIEALAKKHSDCMFLAFTNATLVTDEMAARMAEAGNIVPAVSIEGFAAETDMRRGAGTFAKVVAAMETLKRHGVAFGFSACYHSRNTEAVASEEFLDFLIEQGCLFGWYFTYMPLGKKADVSLLATPRQREFMYHTVRKFRREKPIFVLDFWNDGGYTDGCIAGGKRYIHINANGDAEPCAFIHYADRNIKSMSLLEVLRSPLFQQYAGRQPFNSNHLRPCPLLDNPEALQEMVTESGAKSTQLPEPEEVSELTAKCIAQAAAWADVADRLWRQAN